MAKAHNFEVWAVPRTPAADRAYVATFFDRKVAELAARKFDLIVSESHAHVVIAKGPVELSGSPVSVFMVRMRDAIDGQLRPEPPEETLPSIRLVAATVGLAYANVITLALQEKLSPEQALSTAYITSPRKKV